MRISIMLLQQRIKHTLTLRVTKFGKMTGFVGDETIVTPWRGDLSKGIVSLSDLHYAQVHAVPVEYNYWFFFSRDRDVVILGVHLI